MRHTGSLMMALGGLLVLFYPSLWVYGRVSQLYLHKEWENRAAVRQAPAARPTHVFGRLVIPSIFLDEIIVQGVEDGDLAVGPGHFPFTALPGEGNCAIAGHLNINGSPFRDLQKLKVGDVVAVQTDNRLVEYSVKGEHIIPPTDMTLLSQSGPSRLTLVTCMPGAQMRYVVTCAQTKVE